jgi:hypothetical protein
MMMIHSEETGCAQYSKVYAGTEQSVFSQHEALEEKVFNAITNSKSPLEGSNAIAY